MLAQGGVQLVLVHLELGLQVMPAGQVQGVFFRQRLAVQGPRPLQHRARLVGAAQLQQQGGLLLPHHRLVDAQGQVRRLAVEGHGVLAVAELLLGVGLPAAQPPAQMNRQLRRGRRDLQGRFRLLAQSSGRRRRGSGSGRRARAGLPGAAAGRRGRACGRRVRRSGPGTAGRPAVKRRGCGPRSVPGACPRCPSRRTSCSGSPDTAPTGAGRARSLAVGRFQNLVGRVVVVTGQRFAGLLPGEGGINHSSQHTLSARARVRQPQRAGHSHRCVRDVRISSPAKDALSAKRDKRTHPYLESDTLRFNGCASRR